jgi:hypothetical protein
MDTRIDEIAPGIIRLSTFVSEIAGGFTFNQFLVMGDEPLLFHCGPRSVSVSLGGGGAGLAAGAAALDRLRPCRGG